MRNKWSTTYQSLTHKKHFTLTESSTLKKNTEKSTLRFEYLETEGPKELVHHTKLELSLLVLNTTNGAPYRPTNFVHTRHISLSPSPPLEKNTH